MMTRLDLQHLQARRSLPGALPRWACNSRPSQVAAPSVCARGTRNSLQRAVSSAHQGGSLAAPWPAAAPAEEVEVRPGVAEGSWTWRGHRIRFLHAGAAGPALVCVHGFGSCADHFRLNLPALGRECRAYAIDLLGYGLSDKPSPFPTHQLYTFETWAQQLRDFIEQWVGEPAFLICNSAGGIVGLQAAIDAPALVRGVLLMDVPQRKLHIRKQAPWQRPLVAALQHALRDSPLGQWYFHALATPQSVRAALQQCYCNPKAVTDELLECLLRPGLQPGAAEVFLEAVAYSEGPLAEEQLQAVTVPVSIVWGERDPWEPLAWGRELAQQPCVEEFVCLPGVGHCPQDEAPEQVNPLILRFVRRHSCSGDGAQDAPAPAVGCAAGECGSG